MNLQLFVLKNVFPHDEIDEEIYMEVLLDFGGSLDKNKAFRLKKAWFGRFIKVMLALGFKQNQGNKTLFIRNFDIRGVTPLLVCIDDIIMIKSDPKEKEALRQLLAEKFQVKDLGKLKYLLGIKVAQLKEGIFVS